MNNWKCLDGECLYMDLDTGKTFITSPDPQLTVPLTVFAVGSMFIPLWFSLLFWLAV